MTSEPTPKTLAVLAAAVVVLLGWNGLFGSPAALAQETAQQTCRGFAVPTWVFNGEAWDGRTSHKLHGTQELLPPGWVAVGGGYDRDGGRTIVIACHTG